VNKTLFLCNALVLALVSGSIRIDLFADTASEEKDDRLSKALDAINAKYGRGTIFHLSEGIAMPWQMKREMLTPNYTTGWSQIPVVK